MTKARKLYMIRTHDGVGVFGKTVGHKSRLVPYAAARKIAKRIRATKKFELVEICPVAVNCTAEQIAYLERRYA